MATPDHIRTRHATETFPPNIAPFQAGETPNLPRLRRERYSTRNAPPPSYPRIPRLVSKNAKSASSTLDSQLQVNASHVQKPLSLIGPNESAEKSSPLSGAVRRSPMFQDEKPLEVHSSSSSEQYESSRSNPTSLTNERSRTSKRGCRVLSPTDSDDEDPFHFDNILSSSSPTKRETHDDSPSRALSSSLFRRASIVPVDPNAEPAPHRFSLLREHASEETIFVQEICDAEGRRWSLRVPASGLPQDMVHMLEELEKLAVELGQAMPRIVVTCSAESLSMKRMERDATAVNSSKLLRPPPAVGDESSTGYDAGTGLSLAKEKNRIVHPECGIEEPGARLPEQSFGTVSSPSEKSLTCIYLPELAPEFLSGSSTSPVLQPAHGFHSKPAQTIQCPRQRAFFSALKEPQPTSSIAKRLIMPHSAKTGSELKAPTATASEAMPPSYSTALPVRSKSRTSAQTAKSKSALPILKTTNLRSFSLSSSSSATAAAVAAAATNDRRRSRWASLSKSPPLTQPEILKASSAAQQQQQQQQQQQHQTPPVGFSDHASSTKTNNGAATTIVPSGTGADADVSTLQHQNPAPASSTPSQSSPSQPPSDRGEEHSPAATTTTPRSVSLSAPTPPTGRKLRHLFRRPPVRSASDPPLYSSYSSMRPVTDGGGSSTMKRPASEVVPLAPREVVAVVEQRRMPRLPSARDLLRKLT